MRLGLHGPRAPAPRGPCAKIKEKGKSPKGGRHLRGALGRRDSSPSLAAPLPWRRGQGCALPLSLGPIYSGVGGPPKHTLCLWCSPSLSPKFFSSPVVLGEALQDCHAPPPPPRHCAAAGWSLPQPLPLSLLDQGMGDVTGLYVC